MNSTTTKKALIEVEEYTSTEIEEFKQINLFEKYNSEMLKLNKQICRVMNYDYEKFDFKEFVAELIREKTNINVQEKHLNRNYNLKSSIIARNKTKTL